MKKSFVISFFLSWIFIILFCAFECKAQPVPIAQTFGVSRPIDSARSLGSLIIDSAVRFKRYATSDSNKVLGINEKGILTLRTGGSGTYHGISPTNQTLGGLPSGSNISNLPIETIIQSMLVAYLSPYFASFSVGTVLSQYEVGATISGPQWFTWTFGNASNVTANTLDILDVTTSNPIATNISITSPASYSIGTITNSSPSSHTWRINADNTVSTTFTSDYTANWYYSIYSGVCAGSTPDNSEVLAGFSALSTTNDRVTPFSIVISGTKHIYLASPVAFGHLTNIVIDLIPSFTAFTETTQTITNAQGVGVSCYVYTSISSFSNTTIPNITAL